MGRHVIIIVLLNVLQNAVAQSEQDAAFVAMFYNVENLFDCKDDSLVHDEEFLPNSEKNWNYSRYIDKLNKISKVILSANGWYPPSVIGLCEVENEKVLNDLIWKTGLNHLGYRVVHFDSPDKRGIDVAFLYRQNLFEIIEARPVNVSQSEKQFYTRDILWVKGIYRDKDTLNVLVNHWPSKWGGTISSEWRRKLVARKILSFCDSIGGSDKGAKFMIMGDFNESPEEPAVSLMTNDANNELSFMNLTFGFKAGDAGVEGSHKYKGHWGMIDQIIISKNLTEDEDFNNVTFKIVDLPFLLEEDKGYSGTKPYRTYRGPCFHGGYSDHLPVIVIFQK
ncbi:endonuclease [Marinilabiliaceae bacterium JC017]|nr:endonuclease [Marinilabiliaceae bacterium JC017]